MKKQSTQALTVRIPVELHTKAKHAAVDRRMPLSKMIIEALEAYLEKEEEKMTTLLTNRYADKEDALKVWEDDLKNMIKDHFSVTILDDMNARDYYKEKKRTKSELWACLQPYFIDELNAIARRAFSVEWADEELRKYTNLINQDDDPLESEEIDAAREFLDQYTDERVNQIFYENLNQAFTDAYAYAIETYKSLNPSKK